MSQRLKSSQTPWNTFSFWSHTDQRKLLRKKWLITEQQRSFHQVYYQPGHHFFQVYYEQGFHILPVLSNARKNEQQDLCVNVRLACSVNKKC